jgi:gliding motility-associated-like protein
LWSNGAQTSSINQLIAGFYSVTLTDSKGCTFTASPFLSQPPPLDFSIQKYHPDCTGPTTGWLQFTNYQGGVQPYQFGLNHLFSDEARFDQLGQGSYELTLRDANGCLHTLSDTLVAAFIPKLELGDDLELILGCSQRLQVSVNVPVQTITWWPATGLSCTDCLEPDARPFLDTEYFLKVISKDGCFDMDSLRLKLIPQRDLYVPTIFSPDKDGENDFLTIYAGKSIRQVRSFQIYSRWGELVFEQKQFPADQPTLGWNGSYNNQPAPAGVYVWTAEVEFLDNSTLRLEGNATLIR